MLTLATRINQGCMDKPRGRVGNCALTPETEIILKTKKLPVDYERAATQR